MDTHLDKILPWIDRFFAQLDERLISIDAYKQYFKSLDNESQHAHARIFIRTLNSITPEDQHFERTKHVVEPEPVASPEETTRVADLFARQQEIKLQMDALQKEKHAKYFAACRMCTCLNLFL